MTVYLPKRCRTWYYDFWFKGRRYLKSTGQITREDAEDAERQAMRVVRRRAAGLPALDTLPLPETPRFTDWAVVTLAYAIQRKKLKRPEEFETNLKMILGFWGARPTKHEPIEGVAPYRDLRLSDPIADPALLEAFEQWMDVRGISGSRKNHYRSACSQMYRVALLPANRKRSGVAVNPFAGVLRDRVPKRIRIFTLAQLRRVIELAPWHTGIALAIGGLSPKLRLRNVLQLRWGEHVNAARTQITVPEHKTDRETGLPLVVNVSPELKTVLDIAWEGRHGPYVVQYHGAGVEDIKTGLKHAVESAGLVFGRKGLSYHSLRHTMGTEFARMHLPEALRARLLGHSDLTTTQIYTHLVAADEVEPLAALGARMPIADMIGTPPPARGRRPKARARRRVAKKRL